MRSRYLTKSATMPSHSMHPYNNYISCKQCAVATFLSQRPRPRILYINKGIISAVKNIGQETRPNNCPRAETTKNPFVSAFIQCAGGAEASISKPMNYIVPSFTKDGNKKKTNHTVRFLVMD